MYNKTSPLSSASFVLIAFILTCTSVRSQIVPDSTLGNEKSNVTPNADGRPIDLIEGGAKRGGNLFHSFEQFSVPTGGTAYFNNAADIQNIISRVTGLSISNIDGLLRANGTANVFLLNPNGIIFGPNASLSIGGSFVASTASSLNFADGTQFSATAPQTTPLLTVSVPIGLRFTLPNPGPITVEGSGHNLSLRYTRAGSPILGSGESSTGLRTTLGKTIALVGGNVNFDGGILTAVSGGIEVGSVNSGSVSLNSTANGIFLDYSRVDNFQDIKLDKRALLDASGFVNGNIFLNARNLVVTNGSFILISNFGELPSGKINIKTTDSFEISNFDPNDFRITALGAGIGTQNFSTGKGADIFVLTKKVVIQRAFGIATETFGSGAGGDINLKVLGDSVQGPNNTASETFVTRGAIATFASGNQGGDAGNIELYTNKLFIQEGATLASETFGSGDGGNVILSASEGIKISGFLASPFNSFLPTFLGALTTSSGDAGYVNIKTGQLIVEKGARLDSTTLASGAAGSITINAAESITVSGKIPGSSNPTLISSSANTVDPIFKQFYSLPSTLNGKSGSITINTNRLTVQNEAQISVRNDGVTNGGDLQIKANSINLDNRAGITASTQSGEGGDISINSRDLLLLRRNSKISAEAGGTGNGGNITINAPFIIAVPQENSDIIANATRGQGGNINITAQGIFGIQPRNQNTPLSDITASSDFGVNGVVEINRLDTDPSRALVTLPAELSDATRLIAQGCPGTVGPRASKFVVTGRGGIPENPNEALNSKTVWTDSRLLLDPAENQPSSPSAIQPTNPATTPLVEANGWTFNSKGEVVLTAAAPTIEVPWITPSNCHAS